MRNKLVPGMITPGRPARLKNDKVTEFNDLTKAGLEKPALITATAKYFSYKCGMLSEIFMHLGKNFNTSMLNSTMIPAEKRAILKRSFQFLDNYRFMYHVNSPQHKMLQFVKDPASNDTFLGHSGKHFKVYVNDVTLNKDDVILLDDLTTQIMIIAPPVKTPKYQELTVRLNFVNKNQTLHRSFVSAGSFGSRHTNYKPERSTDGSRFELSSNDMAMGYMSTHRFQTDESGHASVLKNNIKWFTYVSEDGSEMGSYWIDIWKLEMLKKSWEFIENQLWNGIAPRNPDGSAYADAITGKKYIAGDGMYTQCRSILRKAYNNMSRGLFEDIALELKKDSIGNVNGDIELLFLGGLRARTEFSNMIAKEFGSTYTEKPFYYEAGGFKGYESNFRILRLPFATIYMAPTDYFDQKHLPSRKLSNGHNANSYTAYLINISQLQGGMDGVSLVTIPGRDMKQGYVNGMAKPGPGGVLSTTEDVHGIHLLRTAGIAVHNVNCMAEIYKPVAY